MNPHIEMEAPKILSIISEPSEDVIFSDSSLKFKYKVSGVPFRFTWDLTGVDTSIILFPILDALIRQKRQILEFRKLPNSDPKMLDQLPAYSDFDVAGLFDDKKSIEALSGMCANKVKVRETEMTPPVKNLRKTTPKQTKGALKYQSMKRGLFAEKPKGQLYDSSDSSQVDSQEKTPERKKRKTEEEVKTPSSSRLRTKFKI